MSTEPATLATGQDQTRVSGIAMDESFVYWTAGLDVADGVPSGGTVMRVALAGGTPEILASDLNLPTEIVVDAHNVYWLDKFWRQVMRAPSSGGDPLVLAESNEAWSLAVDGTSAYWLDFDIHQRRTIRKAPLTGGAATELVPVPIVDTSHLYEQLGGLAVDSGRVYWSETDLDAVKLMAVSVDGGAAMTLFSATSSSPTAGPIAIAGSSAYFVTNAVDYGDSLLAVSLGGGSATSLSRTSRGSSSAIAIDARNVFWVESATYEEWTVMKAARNGGPSVAIATSLQPITDVATNGSQVCWATFDVDYSVTCLDTCE